jgi:phage terminase large subunit-like protein
VPVLAPELVRPTFEWVPPAPSTELGREATDLAASAGLFLDPWQVYALDRILAEHEDGVPVAFEVGLVVPRQNGKGSVLEALSLAWLFLTDAPLILHSAHEFKTARQAFRRLQTLIRHTPHLMRRVGESNIKTAAGNESISTYDGQELYYVARSKGSGRGFTSGKIILDEAYAIEAEEMAAMLPTLATQPEAQIIYTSSAGMVDSTQLRALRDRGRRGGEPDLCYLEWGGTAQCPPNCRHLIDDAGCALNDRAQWASSNPGKDIRISESFIAKERRALPAHEFGRERLGIWDEPSGDVEQFLAAWLACKDETSTSTGRPVFALDVSPGSRSAAVVAATRRPDGLPHVEVVEHLPGADWLPAWCEQRKAHRPLGWVLDPAGPVGSLLPDLAAVGVEPTPMTARDMGQACEALTAAASASAVRHVGDPILTGAIAGAGRRDIGDGLWAWSRRKSGTDICPLVAATEALWLLSKEPPAYDLLQSFY